MKTDPDHEIAERITARGAGPWIKEGIVEALRTEREVCAKIAEGWRDGRHIAADAIRARTK